MRFWSKVDIRDLVGCWEWTAGKFRFGYGCFHRDGFELKAHRVAYEMAFGHIPEGLCVLHKCDNPGCVNPTHLFLGTLKDNRTDMLSKSRQARGERAGNVKLTQDAVYIIRKLGVAGVTQTQIANRFGVSWGAIHSVLTRRTWKHI